MRFLFFFSFVFSVASLTAQVAGTFITGTVVDKLSQQPIAFVNVMLLRSKDSSTATGCVTDKKGKFSLPAALPGNYILRYSYIGMSGPISRMITIGGDQKSLVLGVVELSADAKQLSEVILSSSKSSLNTSIDRKVYNVDQDLMSKSGAASDILKNIPSVEVDIDGNVSLRGASEVTILINGKPSPLMGSTRAEVIQSLPANSIERIEVITNPSARYRPDGSSGIINIVLKKNIKRGWNGTISATAGNMDRYNGNILLNYNPGKINLFGSYSLRKDSRTRTNQISRTYLDSLGGVSGFYNDASRSKSNPMVNMASAGMDYTLNKHSSFGISGNYYERDLVKPDVVNKFTYNNLHMLTSQYDRIRYDPEFDKKFNATAYYEQRFKKQDESFKMEFNTAQSKESEDNHFRNVNLFPLLPTTYDNTHIGQIENNNQLTMDYSRPINESSKLEAGYDGSLNKRDFNFFGEFYDTAQAKFVKDFLKSNQFIYQESIQAIYLTYQKSYHSFGYSAGLRAEQVNIRGNLVTLDSAIKNNFTKAYPTLHLSYKIAANKEIQLNYSRRINRPDAEQLNPFPEYRDPQNLQAGNARLKPEMIHSAEFGYKWQNKKYSFVPSVYYRNKTNGYTQVIKKINDTTFLTTTDNLAHDQSAGVELIFSAKLGNIFNGNMSSNFSYNQIDASNMGYSNKKSILSFSTNFNSSVTLSKSTMLQISSNYRSARLTAQGRVYPTFVTNVGMRQDLLKRKLALTLTASDLFATMRDKRELTTSYLSQTSIGKRDVRIIYLGANYRFGKSKKAPKEEKLQFDNGGA
jgi:outer membrane receptor protein involved in Fe transport